MPNTYCGPSSSSSSSSSSTQPPQINPTLEILRPLLLFLLLLLLHLRHSLSSPHRLLSTPTRPKATYRALLSLKSSLDDPDPDSRLSALSALRLLNLSNNVFNRTFSPELSNLTNLRVLDLYNNNLTGVLPVSVATFHWHNSPHLMMTGYNKYQFEFKVSQSKKLIGDMAAASVKDFPSSIKEIIENCSQESLHFSEYLRYQAPWGILQRRFRVGTVTVAGDAFHAMAPFIAQGGAASLEDAVVLARYLARTTNLGNPSGLVSKTMVEAALDEFLKERKPRVLRLSL
ncbi:hypothetical protein ACLB2K_077363 [Fragaria x ananassa]